VLCCALLPSEWIAAGVALSVSIAGTIQLVIAAWLLRGRIDGIDGSRILRSLLVYTGPAVAAIIVGGAALVLLGGTVDGGFAVSGIAAAITSMAIIGILMAVVYFGILWLVRAPELRAFAQPYLDRLRRG
jgi:putative peptidoglycan lipid II flippase